jgi:hypothetical protein
MPTKRFAVALLLCFSIPSFAQRIATFRLEIPAGPVGIPVRINLDEITFISDSLLSLVEVSGNTRTPVPFQISRRELYWMVHPDSTPRQVSYELVKGSQAPKKNVVALSKDGTLTLTAGDKNLLRYYYETLYPPAGVDSSYKRSGFIHPLWSPHGQELTRIQPKDHYHHYGIWNPWTHVLYEGDTVDFWNLRGRKGLVRFARFISTTEGDLFGEFRVLHEHVVLKPGGSEEVALNELQTVRVYDPAGKDYYIADLTFTMNCATESPVRLLEYRYGGLGWRTTEAWNKDNSEVLSSQGLTRKDADGSKGRWCIVQGEVGGDYAGVVMMSFPANYNHPEPLRIWPENQYGRGDMFANFSPTKDTDWLLEPGKDYVLKYRLVVFNGKFAGEQAESAWQNYVTPIKLTVIKD